MVKAVHKIRLEVDAETARVVERRRQVIDRERDVVRARSLAIEVLGDRPPGVRFEQLEVPAAVEFEEDDPHVVERLLVGDRRVEQAAEQVSQRRGVSRRDADVVEAHTGPSRRGEHK